MAGEALPPIASGDFHRPENLDPCKTLLPSSGTKRPVVACLRSGARVYLTPYAAEQRAALPLAA